MEKREDMLIESPFYVSGWEPGKEIVIDFESEPDGPILVQCINCKKEFDPGSKESRNIPTINFCSECYEPGF